MTRQGIFRFGNRLASSKSQVDPRILCGQTSTKRPERLGFNEIPPHSDGLSIKPAMLTLERHGFTIEEGET